MTRTALTAFAATLLVSISGSAFATDTPAASPAAAAPSHPVKKAEVQTPDDVICKSEPVTGSRLETQRTCMTREQWSEQNASARNALMGGHPDGVTPGR